MLPRLHLLIHVYIWSPLLNIFCNHLSFLNLWVVIKLTIWLLIVVLLVVSLSWIKTNCFCTWRLLRIKWLSISILRRKERLNITLVFWIKCLCIYYFRFISIWDKWLCIKLSLRLVLLKRRIIVVGIILLLVLVIVILIIILIVMFIILSVLLVWILLLWVFIITICMHVHCVIFDLLISIFTRILTWMKLFGFFCNLNWNGTTCFINLFIISVFIVLSLIMPLTIFSPLILIFIIWSIPWLLIVSLSLPAFFNVILLLFLLIYFTSLILLLLISFLLHLFFMLIIFYNLLNQWSYALFSLWTPAKLFFHSFFMFELRIKWRQNLVVIFIDFLKEVFKLLSWLKILN